jgi:hypothetical protein
MDKEMADPILEKLFKYYLDHQDELVEKYNGKYLVIHDFVVDSSHDSEQGAYFYAKAKFTPGLFLIQKCTPGDEAYTMKLHSHVSFTR